MQIRRKISFIFRIYAKLFVTKLKENSLTEINSSTSSSILKTYYSFQHLPYFIFTMWVILIKLTFTKLLKIRVCVHILKY